MTTYVYAFAHAAHPLAVDGAHGVGPDAPPIRVIRQNGLAAVVSDAPEDLRPKRRDLEIHEALLEQLCESGTVLPMRFGTVAPDDAAVEAELRSSADTYARLLARVDGKVELNVKALHREDDVLRDLLTHNQPLRDWNERLRAAGGGDPEARIEFGEEVAAALEDRRAADAEQVLSELRTHAEELSMGPAADNCFVNASFLVTDTARPDFAAAMARVRDALAAVADVNVYGPLPPYSFVATQ